MREPERAEDGNADGPDGGGEEDDEHREAEDECPALLRLG
eukprot:CAMPEP_0206170372 /NCGR_PEP_ID=MMETSP1474-20131121/38850_1 /ASSEMBLY_ACC=CAM_ASM_001110 /TAXON_ID=97495 /ORGANISM="Imantonia sp., Strain RCC918" /LENGTH=39 /DNA_ID= /DNA_START= /DNA_END= /DNA_ORIENTATION=